MVNIVVVQKTGELKEIEFKGHIDEIYKKCSYRKKDGFEIRSTWNLTVNKLNYNIELYGKIEGKAGFENKYDFPPPVDKILFFGNMVLVNKDEDKLKDICVEEWNVIYEKLFGGFENLDDTAKEDENEVDELINLPDSMKTKDGYLKDGFVIDNDDSDSDTYSGSELEEDEYSFESD
jgi:hypothetical protein